MKKILHIDMDGVIADFEKGFYKICPDIILGEGPDYEARSLRVDQVLSENTRLFLDLEPIEGAIESIKELDPLYDIHFLSTPVCHVPDSFADKKRWLDNHFGRLAHKKLILTHRKDLVIGHFLVDDRIKNGVDKFSGLHIHFGTEKFPNWEITRDYLKKVA